MWVKTYQAGSESKHHVTRKRPWSGWWRRRNSRSEPDKFHWGKGFSRLLALFLHLIKDMLGFSQGSTAWCMKPYAQCLDSLVQEEGGSVLLACRLPRSSL